MLSWALGSSLAALAPNRGEIDGVDGSSHKRAVAAFAGTDVSAEEVLRWGWLASRA